jgi:gliding motility-associated-like protein
MIATNGTCTDTARTTIIVDVPTTIVIPNVFSPNGDNINEEFGIVCTGMKSLTCDIFNRWGQKVFTITAPNQTWDGRMDNGHMASEGTYFFMVNALGVDGKTYTYQGPLTLVK